MIKFFENIGGSVINAFTVFLDFVVLCFETLYWILIGPFRGEENKFY